MTPAQAIENCSLPTKHPIIWVKPGNLLTAENGVRLGAEDWPRIAAALKAGGFKVVRVKKRAKAKRKKARR